MEILQSLLNNPLIASHANMSQLMEHPILALVVAIVIIGFLFKIAFYTIKRVVFNIVLGYIFYFGASNFTHTPMDMSFLGWILTAPLGPIPVIVTWIKNTL